MKLHQSKMWYYYITNKANIYHIGEGEGMTFCEFLGPLPYQNLHFWYPPIANIGSFNTFIYKNAFPRPPIPKIGNFKTFIYINAFSRPQYQKMAFLIPLIQRNAFSRPLHTKNRDPHNVFAFFYPIQNNPSYKMVKFCRPHI